MFYGVQRIAHFNLFTVLYNCCRAKLDSLTASNVDILKRYIMTEGWKV